MADAEGVLVGYDGSRFGERALYWAAREARDRSIRLTVCHAWGHGEIPSADEAVLAAGRRRGIEILARGVRLAQALMGTGPVAPLLADGRPAAVLCENSRRAVMTVVGARGTGGAVPGLLVGSVAAQVATYSAGLVVVERGHWRPAGGDRPAPWWRASARRPAPWPRCGSRSRKPPCGRLRCWPSAPWPMVPRLGAGSINCRRTRSPCWTTWRRSIRASPWSAGLPRPGRSARLGGVRGMRLGSVGQGALHDAPCPVAIVGLP